LILALTETRAIVFYFQVQNGLIPDDAEAFTCHYFNIVESGAQTTQTVVTALVNPYAVSASSSSAASPVYQILSKTPDITLQAAVASADPTSIDTSSSSTATSTLTNTSDGNGLSTGSKIGIGVGVGVGLLCLIIGAVIGFCFWRRSRRTPGHSKVDTNGYPFDYQHVYEHDQSHLTGRGTELKHQQGYQEPMGELPAHQSPTELSVKNAIHPAQELSAIER
jgi:hypothetical protein